MTRNGHPRRLDLLCERFKTFEENGERYKLIDEIVSVDTRLSAATESVASLDNAENIATVEWLHKQFKAFEEDEDPTRGKCYAARAPFGKKKLKRSSW